PTAILPCTVNLLRTNRKSLDHIRRQLFKHATKGELNQLIGKLKVEMKLDTTRLLAQRRKLPSTNQFLERPIHQTHKNTLVTGQLVAGSKRFADPSLRDIYRRSHLPRSGLQNPTSGTTRQKLRIRLNVIH